MKSLWAFMKKEWMEQIRSSRMMLLGILFVLFGIMNPAIAKLTPWLLEVMADSLAENGMVVTTVTVDAMTSWVQFFKNIPMGLMVFLVLESNIFAKEYQSGTLILALTKGLERYKVFVAKTIVLLVLWSAGYWICFSITYTYNAYFWDNAVAQNLLFSVTCWWIFGVWTICLLVLFSAIFENNTQILLGVGAVVLGSYLIGLLPRAENYMPTKLMEAGSLLVGTQKPSDDLAVLIISVILCILCVFFGVLLLNKKKL